MVNDKVALGRGLSSVSVEVGEEERMPALASASSGV